jgi:RHS repeat-associated protein
MTDSNGLNYMRARYYSPTLKRFINADTLKGSINDGETLNNYAYANGNPISMVDPFGRCADEANDESESIFSEIGGFSSNLYNKLNDDTIYVTGYNIDFNLNALSMGEYGALAETGEDVLKGADELGEFLSKGAGKALSGPVEVSPPPGATPEQIEQVKAYVDGSNKALEEGALSPTGRVSTKGALRRQASRVAQKEGQRAAAEGQEYEGHVGHVPDTTWTGTPEPHSWLDLDPSVNMSIGGQSNGYPIGYKPTEFIFKEGLK